MFIEGEEVGSRYAAPWLLPLPAATPAPVKGHGLGVRVEVTAGLGSLFSAIRLGEGFGLKQVYESGLRAARIRASSANAVASGA